MISRGNFEVEVLLSILSFPVCTWGRKKTQPINKEYPTINHCDTQSQNPRKKNQQTLPGGEMILRHFEIKRGEKLRADRHTLPNFQRKQTSKRNASNRAATCSKRKVGSFTAKDRDFKESSRTPWGTGSKGKTLRNLYYVQAFIASSSLSVVLLHFLNSSSFFVRVLYHCTR